ncbi:protoporphyrinogen/coproporphyrinogen oxidase [Propioniciclava tarda]|uniref:Protoporphyrinogen oxidase n=1 Tax=Propioniciclava tarda TaxID=433330 RepID=A0A4Q9KKP0_PROTD|nr:FAD-dependent oxidoreductase [Propioniciclava tarda]TBT94440.1 protoporphyrinogen oxidase [Propioniciclava tarda]SMO70333.1 oxygen-dependent protoporphyrinogen oxidase [Propioniciclava tarda]
MSDVDDLPAVVVGGGLAGLNAARELAMAGVQPLVIEARHRVGGLVFGDDLGGVAVDLGAESFAKRSRYAAQLCRDLGLEVLDPSGRSWIWSHADGGHAFEIPHGVLGIPTSLDDPDVVRALSPAGLARAREDLVMGSEIGSDADDLASFVTARLGREVLDVLVEPIAGGVHSADPAELAVDTIVPGLRATVAAEGSLTAAARAIRASAPAGAVVSSVVGGMFRLPQALASDIEARGGEIYPEMMVTDVRRDGVSWLVTIDNAASPGEPHLPRTPLGQPTTLRTPRLVIALDGRAALDLLRRIPELSIGDWTLPRGADLLSVDLALDCPALDAAPRGSGLLVTPPRPGDQPRVACKALTHYSVKWPWVRERGGHHVLRVSYGRAGTPTVEPPLGETLADVSTLLGVHVGVEHVRGAHTVRFPNSLPPQTLAHRARVAQLDADASGLPGLGITGAWCAGTGLAAVLPHAAAVGAKLATVAP